MNARADDAKSADDARTALSYVGLAGNVVKVEPFSVFALHNTLGAQNKAVGLLVIQRGKNLFQFLGAEPLGGLGTAADKDLVGMVVMVMSVLMTVMAGAVGIVARLIVVMVMMLMLMLVLMLVLVLMVMVAAAIGIITFLIVVMVMMLMLMLMLMLVIVVMMAAAIGIVALLIVMVVMMLMLMLMLVFMIVIMVMVMVAAAIGIVALLIVMVVMMAMMLCLVGKTLQLLLNGVAALHSSQELLAVQLIPRGGNDGGGSVVLAQKGNRLGDLFIACALGVGKHNTTCVFDLIVEELAKVLHIHLAFFNVGNCGKAVEENLLGVNFLHRLDDVGELANARGLDENAVGMVLLQNLAQSLSKIAYQGTTNATAVHFGYFNTGVLHKAAVNADLTKFVFNQNQLFARIGFVQQLFDQRSLTRTQKARENINFCHSNHPF